jgi:hypothetical protein
MPDLTKNKEFVLIEKTFENNTNHLKECNIAIQSYADSLYNAILLDEHVQKVMQLFDTTDNIASVHLTNDYNFTDTTTKKYRYQAIYKIKYYKEDK